MLDRPRFFRQSTFDGWRRFDGRVLAAPVVPCEEDILHGYVMFEALAVGVGQASEAAVVHADGEIQTLDVACRDTRFIRVAEPGFLLGAYYLGRAVAGGALRRLVVFQHFRGFLLHSLMLNNKQAVCNRVDGLFL